MVDALVSKENRRDLRKQALTSNTSLKLKVNFLFHNDLALMMLPRQLGSRMIETQPTKRRTTTNLMT